MVTSALSLEVGRSDCESTLCVSDRELPVSALEEDLVVTFSRRAEVLPHARYDCSLHAFT